MEFDLSTLNWFDVAVISVVFLSTLFAFFRGFIKAGFSLVTWVGSAVIASSLYPYSYSFFATKVNSEKMIIAISSVGVFGVVFVVLALISSRLVYLLRRQRGGAIDRTLGFAFGFCRGAIIVFMVFFSISMTSKALELGTEENPGPKWFTSAKSYNMLKVTSYSVLALLPNNTQEKFVQIIDRAKQVSVSMVESEIKSGGGSLSKSLNDKERDLMKKIISTLPKDDMNKIYQRYEGSTSELSELERMAIFRDILKLYNSAVASGEVEEKNMISESELSDLNLTLNGRNESADEDGVENETGYKKYNIKQMDRLIGNVQ